MCRGVREGRSAGRTARQDLAEEATSEPRPEGGEKSKAKGPRQRGQPVREGGGQGRGRPWRTPRAICRTLALTE